MTSCPPLRNRGVALLQRKCACGGTPGPTGECDEGRKKRGSKSSVQSVGHDFNRIAVDLQPKLRVGQPGERFEQEADRIADDVVNRLSVRSPLFCAVAPPASQREAGMSDRYDIGRDADEVPPIVYEVLRLPGEPLDRQTRDLMEPQFGHDFGTVRVHRDDKAATSALAVGALAYTVGSELVFASGLYAPGTTAGQHLIAHELAHVVQQGAAKPVARAEVRAPASVAPLSVQRQGGGGGSDPISNVSLTLGPKPNVVRQLAGSKVQVTLDKDISATGTAQVSGPDSGRYEFGFLQICRPFDIMRATYHESGADAGPGKDLNRDATNAIRKVQPALDSDTDWFSNKSAKGPNASVTITDRPDSPFEKSTMKNSVNYDISGVAAASFFFTAFAVKGPDGKFRPLKTFYWAFNYCEPLPPGTDFSKPKIGAPLVVSPIATCPGCSENEPGFSKINDPRSGSDTCNYQVTNAWNSVLFDGPGTFSINCS